MASSGRTGSQTPRSSPVLACPAFSPCLCSHSYAGQGMYSECQIIGSQRSCCSVNWKRANAPVAPPKSASKTCLRCLSRRSVSAPTLGKTRQWTGVGGVLQSMKAPRAANKAESKQQSNAGRPERTAPTNLPLLPPSHAPIAQELSGRELAWWAICEPTGHDNPQPPRRLMVIVDSTDEQRYLYI